jgi:hypothetical protein
MLSYTANFKSFYTVSKGIRCLTLLNFSKAKSLLPENLPRVNKTYFSTNSKYFEDLFLSHFNLQLLKSCTNGKVIAYSKIEMDYCDIHFVTKLFESSCFYFINLLANSKSIDTKEYQNLIFYFFVMNDKFFVRASVRLIDTEDICFYDSSINKTVTKTLYNDQTISNIRYMGFYVLITKEKEVKEEDFQRIKISL